METPADPYQTPGAKPEGGDRKQSPLVFLLFAELACFAATAAGVGACIGVAVVGMRLTQRVALIFVGMLVGTAVWVWGLQVTMQFILRKSKLHDATNTSFDFTDER